MIAFLAAHGAEFALGLTVVLVVGALAVRFSRAPLHRHRLAELSLVAAVSAVALLAIPMPRPAATWVAAPSPTLPNRILTDRTPRPPWTPTSWAPTSAPTLEAGTWKRVPVDGSTSPPTIAGPGAPTPVVTATTHPVEPARNQPAMPLDHVVARLFLVGAAVFAAHLVLALVLLRRALRRARPAPDWVTALAARVCDESAPAVKVSSREVRPFCCGLRRGTVVLPASLARRSLATRVEAVLRHEHAHLAQRHPRGRLLAALAAPLLYWHPLYWWLARELKHSAELLADDMAVGDFDKRRYVEELLELAEATRRALVPQVSRLGVLGSRQDFLERMESLLMRRNRLATRSSAQHVTIRSLCACLLLAGVSVAWGMPPQDDPEDPLLRENPIAVSPELGTSRRFVRLVLDEATPAPPQSERLLAAFDIQGAEALGQLMLRCVDNSFEVGAFEVQSPEDQGHRTCTLELSSASLETLVEIVASLEGVDLLAVQSWSPGNPLASGGGPGAAPATDVNQQIALLSEQVDRLAQQYADMQSTHSHILNPLLASSPQDPETGVIGALLNARPEPVTSQVISVQRSKEPFYIDHRGEHSRLITLGCGESQGVSDDDVFEIYRGNTYKGRVRIIRTHDETSWAIVLLEVEGQSIGAGDSATTDL